MKAKLLLTLMFSFFLLQGIFATDLSLNELRKKYISAVHDHNNAEAVYGTFIKIKNPSGKILAYRAALEAIMTKTTWNLFKKVSFLKKSEESFKKAIEKSPDDIEIRFMRLAVQYEIPEYLGFSNDIVDDKKFIIKHINNFDISSFSKQTIKEIYGFMVRCEYFTDPQMKKLKDFIE